MYGYGFSPNGAATRRRSATLSFVFDGALPGGFAVSRSGAAPRFTPAGDLQLIAGHSPRIETRPDLGETAQGLLIEPSSSNLLDKTILGAADLGSSAATISDLSLGALGLLPGVEIASTGADWNRALRNVTLTAGIAYALRVVIRAGSASGALVMIKNHGNGQASQVQGTIGALSVFNPTAGDLVILGQRPLKDGQSWMVDLRFTPTQTASHSIGIGPFSATSGDSVILLACQVEARAQPTSLLIDGSGGTWRGAETVTTPVPAGIWAVTAHYTDGSTIAHPAQTLAAGAWPAQVAGHLARLSYAPV